MKQWALLLAGGLLALWLLTREDTPEDDTEPGESQDGSFLGLDGWFRTGTGLGNVPQDPAAVRGLDALKAAIEATWGPGYVLTSAYRTPSVNHAVGGAQRSKHTRGLAADLVPAPWSSLEAMEREAWESGLFTEVIPYFEDGHLHVAI